MATIDVNLNEEWSKSTLGHFAERPDKETPFDFYIFPNFLDEKSASQLRDDINSSIKLKPKDNDLYKFKQSKDLKCEIPTKKLTPLLNKFVDVMLGKVRQQLEKSTGLKLSSKNFDVTVSRYDVGDYLLCHNDDIMDQAKRHGRALAFIVYLNTRLWTRDDGGALVLFGSDKTNEPVEINNRIMPRPNTLVVFKTSSKSWHAVEEVYCKDDFRLSINGWFHTDEPICNFENKGIEPCPYQFHRPIPLDDRLERFFKEFINPDYLMEKTCFMIRKKFKRNSEINLINFLVKDKYKEISEALKEAIEKEENLLHVGPYNKRNYKRIKLDQLPQVCTDLFDAFKSELFFMFLSRLTGLDLQPPSLMRDDPNGGETSSGDSDEEDDESDEDDDDDDDDDDEDDEEDEDEDEEKEGGKRGAAKEGSNKKQGEDSNGKISRTKDPQSASEASILEKLPKRADEPTTSRTRKTSEDQVKPLPAKRKRVSDPLARAEFRHFEAGSYTMIHDFDFELNEKSALDVILHFNHDFEVNFDDGGYISYIDGSTEGDLHDMDCELLTIEPKSNCLSLVYRCDVDTYRFLKHISKSHKSNYQDLSCVFYEKSDDITMYGHEVVIDGQHHGKSNESHPDQ